MTFIKKTWSDVNNGPITPAEFNRLENGIEEAIEAATLPAGIADTVAGLSNSMAALESDNFPARVSALENASSSYAPASIAQNVTALENTVRAQAWTNVAVSPVVNAGTKIATVTVNGIPCDIYIPEASAGNSVMYAPTISSGVKLGDITIDGVAQSIYAPSETFTDNVKAKLKTLVSALYTLVDQIAYLSASNNAASVKTALTQLSSALDEAPGAASSGGGTVSQTTLSSITASFSQGSAVISAGSSLDALKPYLTVTATYSDSTTQIVASGYTLSGDISTAGTKTITVSYNGKTATFTATVTASSTPSVTYTSQVLQSNYSAGGARFSTDNVSVNFANGDYVEALIDVTTCTQDNENILAIGKAGSANIESYDTANGILFYKRAKNGVDQILIRLKDTDNSLTSDKWVLPSNYASVLIRVDKDGVSIDGTNASVSNLSNILALTSVIIGARGSKLSNATYDHITVYRKG